MGDILGATEGDYGRLKNSVYAPNATSYVNTQDPGAIAALGSIANRQGALASSGVGNGGLADQTSAFGDLQNMAHGNGPSLAGANMQAGLNSTFQNLSNQAMSNQGNVGGGNSQRNLLNAQANAANNVTQQAGQASVAEQLGALSQEQAAAQGITTSQMAQGNFQQGLMQDQTQDALHQSNIGQQDTNNSMALDAANTAAQDKRQAYQLQQDNATASRFSAGMNYAGQALNMASTIAGAVATGGGSLALKGALQGIAPGSSSTMGGNNFAGATPQTSGYQIPQGRIGV